MFEQFKFRKFNPETEVIAYANSILPEIADLSPSDSSARAGMSKMGDHYTAWIRISSSAGKFSAESRADDPRLAVDILDDRIKLKLKKWKSSRWSNRKENNWSWPMAQQNAHQSETHRSDLAS